MRVEERVDIINKIYTWVCNHCFSLAKASARWERLFFLALSISA